MDKKIWLKVIKEELILLDELATGMINDETLSREEAELAVTRSKILVREFEMLLNQLSTKEGAIKTEQTPAQGWQTEPVESPSAFVASSRRPVVPSSPPPVFPSSPPPVVPSYTAPVFQSSPPPVSESPRPQVSESPSPQVPESFKSGGQDDLKSTEPSDYTQHFKTVPLRSLKEGLSLNDRYLFQRELFNNNKSGLDETVEAIDRLTDIKDAVDYLKANFKWNKGEASEKFVQLVKRRFSI